MPPFQVPPPAHRVNRVPLARGNAVDPPSSSPANHHRKPKRKASGDPEGPISSSDKDKERAQAKEAAADRERSPNPKKKHKRKKENRRSRSTSLNDVITQAEKDGEAKAIASDYRPLFTKMNGQDDEMLRRFQAMKAPKVTPSKLRDATFASSEAVKSSPVRPSAPAMRRDQDQRLQHLTRQLIVAKEDAAKKEEASQKRVTELEKEVVRQREVLQEVEKANETNDKMKSDLKDAVACQVCFETLKDPHILSCGHLACRECLTSWFRTPGAYVHEVPETITPDVDTSYQTKVCHVCRSHVTRRPARMYHLRSILEPLGIEAHLPTSSQALRITDDPWHMLFPPVKEKETYKLRDESDQVNRCPECFGEIEDAHCEHCGIEFSDSEADEDFGNEDEAGILDEGSEFDDFLDLVNDSLPGPSDENRLDDDPGRGYPMAPRMHHLAARGLLHHAIEEQRRDNRRRLRVPGAYVDSAAEASEDEEGDQSDVDAASEEEGYEDSFIDDEEEGNPGEEPMRVDVNLRAEDEDGSEDDELEDSEEERARRGVGPYRLVGAPASPVVRRRRGVVTRPIAIGSDSE